MQPLLQAPVSLDGDAYGRSPEAEAVDISTSDDEAGLSHRAQHSGSQPVYRAASYAQRESSDTDTDEDGVLIKRARTAMQQQRNGPARKRGSLSASGQPKPRMGNITLKMLLDEGLVLSGDNNLVSEYKGVTQLASLRPDGRIACLANGRENVFESPSAFSIFFKRMVTPGRKADDGWKTVKFQGKFLDHYKMELARRREGEAAEPGWDVLQTTKKPRGDMNGSSHGQPAPTLKRNTSMQSSSNAVVPCLAFTGRPGSLAQGSQPFQLAVAAGAMVALDFHSHLSAHSVCGLLAGIWDGADQVVRIHHAVPILTTVSEQNGSVSGVGSVASMDQSAVQRANRHISHNLQLSCLGFFRSHPGASAQCRADDVATIAKLQGQLRPHAAHVPFICALCDPAGAAGEDATSAIEFYYCPQLHEHPEGLEDGDATAAVAARAPPPDVHTLQASVLVSPQLDEELAEKGVEDLKHLANHMSKQVNRADLLGMHAGSQDSMLNKLKGSLAMRLPDPWDMGFVGDFLKQLSAAVSSAWAGPGASFPASPRASLAASPAKPLNKPVVHLPSAAPPSSAPAWQQGSGHPTGTDHQLTPKGLSDSEATEDEHPPEAWAQQLQIPHQDDSLSDGTE